MLVLITYDVNTTDKAGRKRLRQVAKQCVNYGVRVQNSVFECVLDPAKCRMLKHELTEMIDCEKDSLRFYDGRSSKSVSRENIWQVQTPQGFRVRELWTAYEKASGQYTDDAALMEQAGFPVQLVLGGYDNIKLTSPEDLEMARLIISSSPR